MIPEISIVISVYNEEENIAPLNKEIKEAMKGIRYEAIFVDDGSTDRSVREVTALNDNSVVLVQLKKNYGQSSALAAGIEIAKGKYICTIDGDLQNDPNDIPWMLQIARDEEWDLVAGIRKKRKDGFLLRKFPSKIANRIIRVEQD